MKYFLWISLFLGSIILGSLTWIPKYDLSIVRSGISPTQITPISRDLVSLDTRLPHTGGTLIEGSIIAPNHTVFLLRVSGVDPYAVRPIDICVRWYHIDDMREACLDDEIGEWETGHAVFTAPMIWGRAPGELRYQIRSRYPLDPAQIHIESYDVLPIWYQIGWRDWFDGVRASIGLDIVTRAEWGADETLRYADSPTWKTRYQSILDYYRAPKTIEQLKSIELENRRENYLAQKFPDHRYQSVTRTENGHTLIWPIQRTKVVDRMVIHHTAETLDKDLSDEALIRAIYVYHTVSRGWGDIGYNYIVGQRGKIYEWRAGGDYVVGAHAAYNNAGSIGISVIGDFEKYQLNRDQRSGLTRAIDFFADKYGIDLSASLTGVRLCKSVDCDLFEERKIQGLSGHRDVGYTSCPGKNIYDELEGFRLTSTVLRPELRRNPESYKIDPIPPEQQMNLSSMTSILPIPKVDVSPSFGGKRIKIRLAFPPDEPVLDISSINTRSIDIRIGKVRLKSSWNVRVWKVWEIITLINSGKVYTGTVVQLSADVLQISNWDRRPSWDTSGRYNDNLFRSSLIIHPTSTGYLVVNELPLEDYLRGLGEVSNTDHPEKIKTITVAARSYAQYYMSKKNRKYNTMLYDGSDNPDEFQKYLWYGYESRSSLVSDAVRTTKGEIIRYGWVAIKPWYFTQSDGKTRSYLEYCRSNGGKSCQDIPYLQSQDDPASIWQSRKWHGVGVSWLGATYAANRGKSYREILQYYLSGVTISR